MRIHALINYSIADLGMINEWAFRKGHPITTTIVYENNNFPSIEDFDLLIILGGVIGAYEEEENPWLLYEKQFIAKAIEANKTILGICLGAQLIAEVLGGKVYPHIHKEIGWWPVSFSKNTRDFAIFDGLPNKLPLFQFHGDTFDLPAKAIWIAESEATRNQAFIYSDRVVGLQFHPEFSEKKLQDIVELHESDINQGSYTQLPKKFLGQFDNIEGAKMFLFTLLDNFEKLTRRTF